MTSDSSHALPCSSPSSRSTPSEPLGTAGPYFDDLRIGDVRYGPALTVTDGHIAVHQAILGDRFSAMLDARLALAVFGAKPIPPGFVINLAIGQSSVFTRRARANLFYRCLQLRRLPVVGETLVTRTEIVALRQNGPRPDRLSTGLAVLRVCMHDSAERVVLDFERCAMLPLRAAGAQTGHDDDVIAARLAIDRRSVTDLAAQWHLEPLRQAVGGPAGAALAPGDTWESDDADPITAAPELSRLTLNLAAIHYDQRQTGTGKRLVFGGHTIGIATQQAAKALPGLAAVVAWSRCDHIAPVYEEDLLTSTISVEAISELPRGGVTADLHSIVTAHRDGWSGRVLDWRFTGVVA
jgi:acyl dehydratase